MDPQLYIECETNLQVAKVEELLGREYARAYRSAIQAPAEYPMPPDSWPGMPDAEPPPDAYTWFYMRAKPIVAAGGVFVIDDAIAQHSITFTGLTVNGSPVPDVTISDFGQQPHTLSDGSEFGLDIASAAKTFDQLSPEAKTALTPPPPPGL